MNIKQQIQEDLKQAMISGNKGLTETLRGLKGVILNIEIAEGKRESGLTDDEVVRLLAKEAKKRQESADLYIKGGNEARADAELAEKAIIETYLPAQLTDDELGVLVEEAIKATGAENPRDIGQVINYIKEKASGSVDSGRAAQLTKESLKKS